MFGGLPGVQILSKCAYCKFIPIYFSEQVEFFNLASIFPSKTKFSQHCFLCVKIEAVRSFFDVFDLFGGWKPIKISCPLVGIHIFPVKIQKCWIFIILGLHKKQVLGGAVHWAEKRMLKNSKIQKVSEFFWNLGWMFSIKCCVGPRKL